MAYAKYLLGLFLLTCAGALVAAFALATMQGVATVVLVALLQIIVFTGLTTPRVLMGLAMSGFAAARLAEPQLLRLMGRIVDLNAKVSTLAEEMAREIKEKAGSLYARVPLLGSLVGFLTRRVPIGWLVRRLTPRIIELIDLQSSFGFTEKHSREERSGILLAALRERLEANLRGSVRMLLLIYGMLMAAEDVAVLWMTR